MTGQDWTVALLALAALVTLGVQAWGIVRATLDARGRR